MTNTRTTRENVAKLLFGEIAGQDSEEKSISSNNMYESCVNVLLSLTRLYRFSSDLNTFDRLTDSDIRDFAEKVNYLEDVCHSYYGDKSNDALIFYPVDLFCGEAYECFMQYYR